MQVIQPAQALKHLDVADVAGLRQKLALDEDMAHRENDELIKGNVLNPWKAQEVMGALRQGMNPATGQPLASPEEAQALITQAALAPTDFEDKAVHLDVHGDFLKGAEFRALNQDAQSLFIQHYSLTAQALSQERMQQAAMDPRIIPKLNVATRATVSAPVMDAILQKHGIDLTEAQINEPPLETNVTQIEQIREQLAPGDLSGGDYFSAQTEARKAEQEAEAHQVDMARQAQEASHAQDLHEQKLRHNEAANKQKGQNG